MSIYHLTVKTVSRSKGKSSTASSAYRAADKIKDERTGEIYDYSKKKGVVESEIILPYGAPEKYQNRSELWNEAERSENRKNSTVAREYEVALPCELSPEAQGELAKKFASELVENYGVGVDLSIHEPSSKGDQRNAHAHILTTTRELNADGFGAKTRSLDDRKSGEIEKIRELWEQHCNVALERAGRDERVSSRSLAEQGVNRPSQIHLGVSATAMERRGVESERGMLNRAIQSLPNLRGVLSSLETPNLPPRTPVEGGNLKNAIRHAPKDEKIDSRASTQGEIKKSPLRPNDFSLLSLKELEEFQSDVEAKIKAKAEDIIKAHQPALKAALDKERDGLELKLAAAQKTLGEIAAAKPPDGFFSGLFGGKRKLEQWEIGKKSAEAAINKIQREIQAFTERSEHEKKAFAGRALVQAKKENSELVKAYENAEELIRDEKRMELIEWSLKDNYWVGSAGFSDQLKHAKELFEIEQKRGLKPDKVAKKYPRAVEILEKAAKHEREQERERGFER